MTRIISRFVAAAAIAVALGAANAAAADQFGENPFVVSDSLTCNGESLDVAIVGIPQAEPESEAAGRPGIAFVIGETTRLVPKSLTFRRYVNGNLMFEGTESWGFGVPDLVTCYQVLEFTNPRGNLVRIELELEVLMTPKYPELAKNQS